MKHAIQASVLMVALLVLGYAVIYGFLVAVSALPYKWMDFNGNGWVSMSEVWSSTDTVVVEKEMNGVKCLEYLLAKELETIKLDCVGQS